MDTKKITKREILTAIKALVDAAATAEVDDVTVTGEDIANYVDTTIAQLDNKAAKAKERAAAVKAEGDEVRAAVQAVLTDELQTIDAITEQVDVEDITKSKVTARLTQLTKAGVCYKEQVKDDSGRKVMAYALSK